MVSQRIGAVVGPHGTGKSTLLHTLIPLLEPNFDSIEQLQVCAPTFSRNRDWLTHTRKTARLVDEASSRLASGDLLIIDGFEQVPVFRRLATVIAQKRHRPALLVTSHRPMFGLPVLFETGMSNQLACDLTEELIADLPELVSRVIHQHLAEFSQSRFAQSRSVNLREFWFDCYDIVQAAQLESVSVRESA